MRSSTVQGGCAIALRRGDAPFAADVSPSTTPTLDPVQPTDTPVSADDLPAVTERCEQLATAASTESLIEESNSSEDSTAGGADATITDAPAVNEAQQATATIDLDTVTLEQCTEAGIPAAM